MRFGIRELLFIAVLLAVPVAAFWYVFKPRNAEIMQARREISEKRITLERLQDATAKIDDLAAAIAEGRNAIAIIEARLPSEQNIDEIVRQVWQIAGHKGLKIKNVQPEKKLPAAEYMELPIKVEASGNFDSFYEFLLDLEQIPRLTRVKELRMKQIEEEPGAMTVSFILSIYFEPRGKSRSGATVAGVNP